MNQIKTLKAIEYDKIMFHVSSFAVLDRSKENLQNFLPVKDIVNAQLLLDKTEEAYKLIYDYGISGIFFFDNVENELTRAEAGGTLNNSELLRIASNLKGARLIKKSIESVHDEQITLLPEISKRIYTNYDFEKEITDKIISADEISDDASPKLYQIRKNIRDINAKIREKLSSYSRGSFGKYLQDNVVTIRQDRYVVPVKSEYRSFVKGFIHDQSSTGSTVFIEPEQVMELNNDLKRATFEENEEIYRILSELSYKVTFISDAIRYNAENVCEIDTFLARAMYSFKTKSVKPILNNLGHIKIIKGRHPIIEESKVVPVSIELGEKYNYLLVTGPNTGGKTVTLKLTGLFTVMAMSGLFLPSEEGTKISIFDNVFCDIGDEQSIEQSLSTFSSHIKNIINILSNIDGRTLILLDELGAGTDPEEGSALALAIINKLIEKNSYGIITTHYSRLKEFAMDNPHIENASMEFDAKTLRPKYRLNIGIPGSSNAIEIAKILGLDCDIIESSISFLSDNQVSFEKVLKKAEESRREADLEREELENIKKKEELLLQEIENDNQKFSIEREKIYNNARKEVKRIVENKLAEAEEIVDELKDILKRAGLESKEAFRAIELKNQLRDSKYLEYDDTQPYRLNNVDINLIKNGDKVYVKSLGCYGKIVSIKKSKMEVEILVGSIKSIVKISDIFNNERSYAEKNKVSVMRNTNVINTKNETNVIGKTVLEAIEEVKSLIDSAVICNFEEVKIIHGVGTGALLKAIREYLKNDKSVKTFRRGNYGEGENGVTIVTLK